MAVLAVALVCLTVLASLGSPAAALDRPVAQLDFGTVCLGDTKSVTRSEAIEGLPPLGGTTTMEVSAPGLPGNVRLTLSGPVRNGTVADYTLIGFLIVRPDTPVGPFSYPLTIVATYTAPDGTVSTSRDDGSIEGLIVPDCKPPDTSLSDRTVNATDPTGAVVPFATAVGDNVDGSVPLTCSPPSGSRFPLGSTTVSCTASDSTGNVGTGSFVVTVVVPLPTITGPSNITVEATGPAGAPVTWAAPTAVDHFGVSVPVSCDRQPATFPLGTTPVSCTAPDAYGGTGGSSFTVTVQDTRAPVLPSLGDVTALATSRSGAVVTFAAPQATDIVDGTVAAVCDKASGASFPIGRTVVTCRATDKAGNVASGQFAVTVVDGAPTLQLPGNLTASATGPGGAVATWSASATDAVDGTLPVSCQPPSGSTFALGTTTVNCSVTDRSGNTAQGGFTVTVSDTTPPVVTVPVDITVDPTSQSGAVVSWPAPTALDAVSGARPVTCDRASGSTFAAGTTTRVTCTATDAAGNVGRASFTVTVRAFTFSGFFQPVDNSTGSAIVYNTVKGGSTVPLKFRVFAGATQLTTTAAIAGFTTTAVSCSTGSEDAVEELSSTGGTSLRYDTTGGQFIQNWQTPRTPGACYKATVTTTSGSTLSAWFKIR